MKLPKVNIISRNIFLSVLTLAFFQTFGCNCRILEDNYSFFKNHKRVFVGKVVKAEDKGDHTIYTFEVLHRLNSRFRGTVLVSNVKDDGAAACTAYFLVGNVYALDPGVGLHVHPINSCNYILHSESKFFNQDTSLFRLLNKKNATINCSYFRGEIKNGKRNGKWEFFDDVSGKVFEYGNFVNGKKDGEWVVGRIKEYYKNGKLIRSIRLHNDSLNITIETTDQKQTMYKNGQIMKILTKSSLTTYYPSGKIKEQAKIGKRGFMIDECLLFSEDGILKQRKVIEKPEDFYEADYWFEAQINDDILPYFDKE